jgi:hypothetical protein
MLAIILDMNMFLRTLTYNIFGRGGRVPGGSRLIKIIITKAKSFLMKLEYRNPNFIISYLESTLL